MPVSDWIVEQKIILLEMKLIKLLYNLSVEQDGVKKPPLESQTVFLILGQ